MKKRLTIFLGIISTLTYMLVSCCNSYGNKTNATTRTTIDFNDTAFIKSIKWDSLNTFVDFHILENGNKTTDTNFHFTVKPIAVYHYINNQFEVISESMKLKFKPSELKEFILSDSFSDRKNFDCLLRINSQIGFQYRPDILRTVIVKVNDMSDKKIQWLITEFKKEPFAESVTSKIQKDTFFNNSTETVFINIKLKPDFWDLKKINEVCYQLNKRPDVDEAFFTDFFTGPNEGESIYHMTTEVKTSR
ncbi:MAG: hypothetical protein IPF63_05170 [Bacteroidetes bacterium]|nr:hypothetical protein [Bacteroidota bacterium]MBL0287006.1 hypothetical protein [Bacteroidota bacterium]